jgi:glyoxylase-like metal-dependent hydrolase (beta-lactamase superfamily II)
MEPNDLVLWIESRRALVAGDTLIDRGRGLEFPCDWASKGAIAERGVPPEQILDTLRPLLELPVELVLPTHGAPTDRAALERALFCFPRLGPAGIADAQNLAHNPQLAGSNPAPLLGRPWKRACVLARRLGQARLRSTFGPRSA